MGCYICALPSHGIQALDMGSALRINRHPHRSRPWKSSHLQTHPELTSIVDITVSVVSIYIVEDIFKSA